jgi:23S rRNA (pseudouridine1915-N3)-methyltransferase
MVITLIWVGKTRNPQVREMLDEYLGRLRRFSRCEIRELRDPAKGASPAKEALKEAYDSLILREPSCRSGWVALDEGGKGFSSGEFAEWLAAELNRGAREIVFVIGGPDGLGPRVLAESRMRLSLGRMTWTHEMCRVLLLEQLYRAHCILRNVPYHRE